MKEQMKRPKREEFIIEYKNQPISPTMYVRTDWQQYSKALEAYIDHLTAEREMKEQNIRELLIHFIDSIRDYESESHNNIGFDDRESDELVDIYLKHNPEILSHHLTAKQGDNIRIKDVGNTPEFVNFLLRNALRHLDYDNRRILAESLHKRTQPQELTVIDWKEMRNNFFNKCTTETPREESGKKVNMAPHDLFEWFKREISEYVG